MLTLNDCLIVSGLLFAVGVAGVVLRKNMLVMLMSLEISLNAANLAVVSFSHFNQKLNGQVLTFFVIAIAAAEVAVGLAIVVGLYRLKQRVDVDTVMELKS